MPTPDATRIDPPYQGPERLQLDAWLDYHRGTLLTKCAGLDPDQLRMRSAEPSTLSLLGLVRHMSDVERYWFRRQFLGADLPAIYWNGQGDPDFDEVDDADPDAAFATYAEEVTAAREAAHGRSLDESYVSNRGTTIDLRWIYIHMIEEYARHNGHADILRERIDGAIGD